MTSSIRRARVPFSILEGLKDLECRQARIPSAAAKLARYGRSEVFSIRTNIHLFVAAGLEITPGTMAKKGRDEV